MPTKVFFCAPVARAVVRLRVYEDGACPTGWSYHNAKSERVAEFDHPTEESLTISDGEGEYAGDPRWPKACGCGYVFTEAATRQVRPQQLVQRTDTGELFEGYRDLPPGAVWNAFWMVEGRKGFFVGDDGRCLICKTPDGHDWMIDGRASNCTMPDDNTHKCWVRHGRPEDGTLHVDKNGHTCAAGAGSIDTGKWHGFLHNGVLTP